MESNGIQAEKAKAMMRYRRLRNVAKMWRVLEFIVALAFLSWSTTRIPLAVELAGRCVIRLHEYLFNPHISFVIGNAIIIAIVLISRQNSAGNNVGAGYLDEHCLQNIETIASLTVSHGIITPTEPAPPRPAEAEETAYDDKRIVVSGNTEAEEMAYDDKQIVVTGNTVTQMQCDAVSTAIDQARKQIKRFQRTQSERLKRELRSDANRKLRRTETEIKQITVGDDDRAISSLDTVDGMSSEEFRRKIEDFIAQHQRFLWAQKIAESENQK
ncbi:hypothetical protein U1Q18_005844 [Sarracenia purpurea var. burkii]